MLNGRACPRQCHGSGITGPLLLEVRVLRSVLLKRACINLKFVLNLITPPLHLLCPFRGRRYLVQIGDALKDDLLRRAGIVIVLRTSETGKLMKSSRGAATSQSFSVSVLSLTKSTFVFK